MSLILGHFGKIGAVSIMPAQSTLKLFRELGLVLFLVGAGIPGGAEFIANFDPMYFVYGVVMTVVPMILGFLFAKYVLKLSLLNNLGSLTGGMTSTPALGTLIGVAGTEDVAAAYAATYPIALIAVVLVSQFLVILF
jgi:putative transport protein